METMSERQDHTLLWEENDGAKCVRVCMQEPDITYALSRPACVCANASMHVCDWTPIARLWRLKPLLSPALILPAH